MVYAAALFFSAIVAFAIALIAWRRGNTPGATGLAAVMAALTVWAGTYGLRWLAADEAAARFWLDATYFGVVAAPTSLLCLSLQYAGFSRFLTKRNILLLSIEPIVTLALIWSDPLHGLFYGGARTSGAILTGGVWFLVNAAYSYTLNLLAVGLLFRVWLRSRGIYKRQTFILILATFFPWIGNILSIAGMSPLPGLDLTPFLFILTGIVFAYSLLKFGFLDMVPVARDFLVESMPEGLIVIDTKARVVDMNPAAQKILEIKKSFLGKSFASFVPSWPELADKGSRSVPATFEISKGNACFEVHSTALNDEKGNERGNLIILRDCTERKRYIEELQYRSEHDILTGLKNREYFESEIRKLDVSSANITLALLDMDNLKLYNDSLGHAAGDSLLIRFAEILTSKLPRNGFVARVGGDEFVIALPESTVNEMSQLIKDLRQVCLAESEIEPRISFSCGWAQRALGESLESTLKRADDAMYKEKNSKKPL